jgi:hypothetical protein
LSAATDRKKPVIEMQLAPDHIDHLAFEFFQEFARCEYCLKAVGLLESNHRDPTADWGAFAGEVRPVIEAPGPFLTPAINYYLQNPPKRQALVAGALTWVDSVPDHKNQSELVLRLVCRVRNNLFHGGKFNGHWFEPQRSKELLAYGIQILQAVVAAHDKVREARGGSAG